MIIKKAVYKKVRVIQNQMVSDDIHGCDHCKAEIKEYPNEAGRLEVSIHNKDGGGESLHFCSWQCLLIYLPKIKTDYFISLPFVTFDDRDDYGNGRTPKIPLKRSGKELIRILKKLNKK